MDMIIEFVIVFILVVIMYPSYIVVVVDLRHVSKKLCCSILALYQKNIGREDNYSIPTVSLYFLLKRKYTNLFLHFILLKE